MNKIYSTYLDQADVDRIHKLEMLDEFEEWHLIQAHYFVLVATRTPLGGSGMAPPAETAAESDMATTDGGSAPILTGEPRGHEWIHGVLFNADAAHDQTQDMVVGDAAGTDAAEDAMLADVVTDVAATESPMT